MIKLIAADMDGTLLSGMNEISDENLQAIKEAEERGIKFAIVTGRNYIDVKPLIDQYNLGCECLALNGAEYYNSRGEIIEGIYIPKNKVKDIIECMSKGNYCVEIYTDKGFYTTNTAKEAFEGMVKRTKTFMPGLSEEEYLEKAKNHPHLIRLNYITDVDEFINMDLKISKFVTFGDTKEEIAELRKEVEKISGLSVTASFESNIEVNEASATKGKILKKVAEDYGFSPEEVVIFGDGLNDYSMFKEFSNSVAMGNAIDLIKDCAAYIAETNKDSGVGKTIKKIINNELF